MTAAIHDLHSLMRIRNLIGRDVVIFHGMTGDWWRGPIKNMETRGASISFDCEWVATHMGSEPWQLYQKAANLHSYPVTSVNSDDPRNEEIIIISPVGYIYIKKPGDSLEKPE